MVVIYSSNGVFLLIHTESRKKDVVQIRKKHPNKIPVSVACTSSVYIYITKYIVA